MTLDPAAPRASAVAVRDGRVLAVGGTNEVRRAAGRTVRRLDCGGATVLPGIVDPHLHLLALATRGAHLDCGPFRTIEELLTAVRMRARALPAGSWLRGEGLDETRLGRLPTATELDRTSPRAPVRLRHRSRHASVLSGAGLQLLGRRAGIELRGGRPTGLVHGDERAISRVVGPLPREVLVTGLADVARELVALGITTVADATPRTWASAAPLREAMASRRFTPRVFAMRSPGAARWRGECPYAGPVKIMVEEGPSGMTRARRCWRVGSPAPRATGRWRYTASGRRRWWLRSRHSPRCRAPCARAARTAWSTSRSARRHWCRGSRLSG